MPNKNIFIIVDGDSGSVYGVLKTEKPYKTVQDIIDKYKKENPAGWAWDELEEYLLSNGYSLIDYEEVYF